MATCFGAAASAKTVLRKQQAWNVIHQSRPHPCEILLANLSVVRPPESLISQSSPSSIRCAVVLAKEYIPRFFGVYASKFATTIGEPLNDVAAKPASNWQLRVGINFRIGEHRNLVVEEVDDTMSVS